jgi:hypothetical protein
MGEDIFGDKTGETGVALQRQLPKKVDHGKFQTLGSGDVWGLM